MNASRGKRLSAQRIREAASGFSGDVADTLIALAEELEAEAARLEVEKGRL